MAGHTPHTITGTPHARGRTPKGVARYWRLVNADLARQMQALRSRRGKSTKAERAMFKTTKGKLIIK